MKLLRAIGAVCGGLAMLHGLELLHPGLWWIAMGAPLFFLLTTEPDDDTAA